MAAQECHEQRSADRRRRQRRDKIDGRKSGMTKPVRVGVLRLVDSAPVVLAESRGLFRDQGLDVQISIEPSWSNIADKLPYGVLDAAVMLPPLALAACAGLRGPKARLLVPMSLSQGGNAIVASNAVVAQLTERNELSR